MDWSATITAMSTWVLAGTTCWLARKTRDPAGGTNETAMATIEAMRRSAEFQEITALAVFLTDDVKRAHAKNIKVNDAIVDRLKEKGLLEERPKGKAEFF